jgi:hypothetical protein
MVPNEYESLTEIAENLACSTYNNYLVIKSAIKTQILLLRALPSNQTVQIGPTSLVGARATIRSRTPIVLIKKKDK